MEETLNSNSTHQQSIELPLRRDLNRTDDDHVLQETMNPRRSPPDPRNELSYSTASQTLTSKPMTEPIRTDPQNILEPKKRKLDRQVEDRVPEVHIVGNIVSGSGLLLDSSEGAMCRWKFDFGKSWNHLSGDLLGQTHVAYSKFDVNESLNLNHPVDVHFAAAGLQGWGAPRIIVQCFRLDWYGRRILHGYGFIHLPMVTGYYQLDIPIWRPVGSADQELRSFLLGETPSLVIPDPIYDSAWKDRARMITTSCGTVTVEFYLITRYLSEQGIAENKSQQ